MVFGVLGFQHGVVRTHGYGASGGVAAVQGFYGDGAVAHIHRGNQSVLYRSHSRVRGGPGHIVKGFVRGTGKRCIQLYRLLGHQHIQLGLIQADAADHAAAHYNGKAAAQCAAVMVGGGHRHLRPAVGRSRGGTQHQLAIGLRGFDVFAVVHRPADDIAVCTRRHYGGAQLQLVVLMQRIGVAVLAQVNRQGVVVANRTAGALIIAAYGGVATVTHIAYINRLHFDDLMTLQRSAGLYQCLCGLVDLVLGLGVVVHHGLGFLIGLLKGNAYGVLIVLIIRIFILLQCGLQRAAITAGRYGAGGGVAAVIGNGTHGGGAGGHKGHQAFIVYGGDIFVIALPIEVRDGCLAHAQGA